MVDRSGPDGVAVPGLGSAVEITTDRWGVPHVVAASAVDAFAGQGYAQARMRLFQIELWRRRGRGLLAEVLGQQAVRLDVAARTFLARNPVESELAVFGPEAGERIEAFVRGVNAHVAEVRADPRMLPPELVALGWEPQPLEVEDLLRIRIHGMNGNADEELRRALTLRDHGPAVERLRRPLEPPHEPVSTGVDLTLLDPEVLDLLRAAREPVAFTGGSAPPVPDGSNNWAIAGSRTRSGRPILANDPHRAMTFPSLRTVIHLACPEFDVIGMNEPYMPGITAGHNERVAWGVTIAPADLEDLMVYEVDDCGRHYRHGGRWREFEVVVERIPVAGREAVTQELRFTVHGPVLRLDPARRCAIALRAAWLEPGMTPYLAAIDLLESRDVEDHRDRLRSWGNPVLNHVIADVKGSIAWQVAGRVPRRSGWDGLLPASGDGRHEWRGLRDATSLPRLVDPPQGWVRSANQHNLDEDPEWGGDPTSYEWYAGYRARRLAELLDTSDDWTVAAAAAIQGDQVAVPFADVVPFLRHPFTHPDAEFARSELLGWDGRMAPASRPAAIFERWLYCTLPTRVRAAAARSLVMPDRADAAAAVLLDRSEATVGDPRVDIALLRTADAAEAAAHVEDSLAASVRGLRAELGPDPATWSWGAIHVVRLVHPLAGLPGIDATLADTGAHPKGGSSDTIGVAYGAEGVQTLGASTRLVLDVGNWDASVWITTPGQDGRLDSAHARDLFDIWLADAHVPLLFSPARIRAAAESVRTLHPAPSTD